MGIFPSFYPCLYELKRKIIGKDGGQGPSSGQKTNQRRNMPKGRQNTDVKRRQAVNVMRKER